MTARLHSNKDGGSELRAADIGEGRILPLRRGEIPVAGTGFAIVSASAVGNGWRAPVIHADLKQGAGGNFDSGGDGASFELARRKSGARRWTPEMPHAIGVLTDVKDDGVICDVRGLREGITRVRREPRLALVEPST